MKDAAIPKSDSVPMAALAPIIRDWCKRSGYALGQEATGQNSLNSGQEILAELSGVTSRCISRILAGFNEDKRDKCKGIYTHVSFDTADKLLCAMCCVEAWHFELKEWYGPIRIAGHEKNFEQPVAEGMAA